MEGLAEGNSAESLPQGRIPDFFIVGHGKSGTSALYRMLRRHPQIFMPDLKEPEFFSRELTIESTSPRGPQTLAEYLALFEPAGPDQCAGEATPSYLRSHKAAKRIAEIQPAARIIAILREPASLVRSLHQQVRQTQRGVEWDLRKAIALGDAVLADGFTPGGGVPPVPIYSERIRYVEQLRRYHDVFPPEQILVLIYDDYRNDNDATVRQVFRFLDVDDTQEVKQIEANTTVGVRSERLGTAMHSVSMGKTPASRTLQKAAKAITPKGLRRRVLQAARQRNARDTRPATDEPATDESLMEELRRRYRDEVVAVSEFLGRDLVTLWGYDRVSAGQSATGTATTSSYSGSLSR
jgi:hypothetical protein